MADEESKTGSTMGEPKPAEMNASVTKKAATKKAAPKKKVATKKAAVKKKAPAKKTAAKKTAPGKATTPAAAAVATASTAPASAPRRHYTPPAKSMWWKAALFIAIALYGFSFIRDAARAPQGEQTPAASTEEFGNATAAGTTATNEGGMMPPMMPMPPMPHMGNGFTNGMGPNGYEPQQMPPTASQQQPAAAPSMPQGMPPQPYGMPTSPYQGYGFYGPGGWYGPGYPMPYPPPPSN